MDGRFSLNGTGLSNPVADSTHINGRHSVSQNFPWGVSSGSPKAKLNGHQHGTRCSSLNRTIISPLKTKIDPLVYADVKAKGFTSRIAQYHENGKRLMRSSSVGGNGYYKTGQFPIVHLDGNKGIPYKATRAEVSMTRIAPPKDSVLYGNTISSLLRSSSIVGLQKTDEDLLHENRPILHPPPTENELAPTRSLIDVLHEISRKRINSDDPLINESTKKSCTNDHRDFVDSGKLNDIEPSGSSTFKRQREHLNGSQAGTSPSYTSAQPQVQQISPEQMARKRYCSHHNDITSSLSSSIMTQTSKRKLLSNTSVSPTQKLLNTSTCSNNSKESDIGDKQQSKIYKNNHSTDNENYYDVITKTKSCNLPMQSLAISGNTERQFPSAGCQQYKQSHNLQGVAVSRTVSAPVKGVEQAAKEIHLPTKPKLTLFNTNYTNKDKSSENIPSDSNSGDDDDNDDDDDEGAGIQFIKPKKINGPMSTKNPLIEKTKQSKLAALLAGLKGELYQEDVTDSAPSQSKKQEEQASSAKTLTSNNTAPITATLSLTKDKDSTPTTIPAVQPVGNNTEKAKEPVALGAPSGGGFQFNAAAKPILPAVTSTNTAATLSTSSTVATTTTTSIASTASTTVAAVAKPVATPASGVASTQAPATSTAPAAPLGGFSFKPLVPNSPPSSVNSSASTVTNTISQTTSTTTVETKSLGGFSFSSPNNIANNSTESSSSKPAFSFGSKTSVEAPAVSTSSSTTTKPPAGTQAGFSFAAASSNSTQNMVSNSGSSAPASSAAPNNTAPTNPANLFNFGQATSSNSANAALPTTGAVAPSKPAFSFGGNTNNSGTNTAATTTTASAVSNSGPIIANANTTKGDFVFGTPASSTASTSTISNSGSSAFSAPKTFDATPNVFGSNVVAPAATKGFSFGVNTGANATSTTSTAGAPTTNTFSFGGQQGGNATKPTATATPFSFTSNSNTNNNNNNNANANASTNNPAPAAAQSIFSFGNNNSNNNSGKNPTATTSNIFGSNASSSTGPTSAPAPAPAFNNTNAPTNNIFGGSSTQNPSQLTFGTSQAPTNSNATAFNFGAAAGNAATNNDAKNTFSFNAPAANNNNSNKPGITTFGQNNSSMNQSQSGNIFATTNNSQSTNSTTIFNSNGPTNNGVQGAFNFGSNANNNTTNASPPAFGSLPANNLNQNKSFSFNSNNNNNNSNGNGTNIFGAGFGGNNNNNSNNAPASNTSQNNAFVFGGGNTGATTNAFGQPSNNNAMSSKPAPFSFGAGGNNNANNAPAPSIFGGINNNNNSNNNNNGQNKAFTFSAGSNNTTTSAANQSANIFGSPMNGHQTPTFNPMTSANTPNGNIFAPPNPLPGERHIRRATRRLQK